MESLAFDEITERLSLDLASLRLIGALNDNETIPISKIPETVIGSRSLTTDDLDQSIRILLFHKIITIGYEEATVNLTENGREFIEYQKK